MQAWVETFNWGDILCNLELLLSNLLIRRGWLTPDARRNALRIPKPQLKCLCGLLQQEPQKFLVWTFTVKSVSIMLLFDPEFLLEFNQRSSYLRRTRVSKDWCARRKIKPSTTQTQVINPKWMLIIFIVFVPGIRSLTVSRVPTLVKDVIAPRMRLSKRLWRIRRTLL